MRWLTRRLTQLRDRSQRGATAAVVGILLVALVGGAGAVAVDVGTLWYDRKTLQTGVDAAALALALECQRSTATCPTPTSSPADWQEAAGYIAKSYRGRALGSCDEANTSRGSVCVIWGNSEVTVRAWDYEDTPFGAVLGQPRVKVMVEAKARWAFPTLPLTFPSNYGPPADSSINVLCADPTYALAKYLPLKTDSLASDEKIQFACYKDLILGTTSGLGSGNFTYLSMADGCWGQPPTLSTGTLAAGDAYTLAVSGNGSPQGNQAPCDFRSLLFRPFIYVPLFPVAPFTAPAYVSGSGANTVYNVAAFAKYRVLGYCIKFSTKDVKSGPIVGGGVDYNNQPMAPKTCNSINLTTTTKNGNKTTTSTTAYPAPFRFVVQFLGTLPPDQVLATGGRPVQLIG